MSVGCYGVDRRTKEATTMTTTSTAALTIASIERERDGLFLLAIWAQAQNKINK